MIALCKEERKIMEKVPIMSMTYINNGELVEADYDRRDNLYKPFFNDQGIVHA